MSRMKAAVFYGVKDLRLEEVPLRKLRSDELLVKIHACGVCGTDVHIYEGAKGSATVYPPVVLGHEFSGEIVEIGNGVRQLKVGDRISVDPNIFCGQCHFCKKGNVHLCENLQAIGVTRNGGFAEYAIVPEKQAYKLPDNLSYEEGAMGEPVACCLHGIDLSGIKHGDKVLIVGAGTIGLIMVQLTKLAGASQIIVSESIKEKRSIALKYGADVVIDPEISAVDKQVKEVVPQGVDVAIECVGTKRTMLNAIQSCARGGNVMMFGLAPPDCEIPLKPFEVFQRELTIKSSFINPFTQARALDLLGSRKIRVADFIADVIQLDQLRKVFEDRKYRSRGKVIIST